MSASWCTEQGIGVLWATHLFDEITPSDDLVVLHQGRVLAHGPVSRVIADAGAQDVDAAFTRLTGAAATPGAPRMSATHRRRRAAASRSRNT